MAFHTLAIALTIVVAAAGMTAADEDTRVRERSGEKQGPLLLGDDMVADLEAFVGETKATGAETEGTLEAVPTPDEDFPPLPAAPQVQPEDAWVFTPPMTRGCRNAAAGTGEAAVDAGGHRGQFNLDLRAAPGEYAWGMGSPCMTFTPDRDGVVRARMAVVVRGTVAAAGALDETTAYLGAWIAHCHPKERGSYSERVGWDSAGMSGTVRFDGYVLMHEATFPVQGGVEHLFGSGLSAACAAAGGGAPLGHSVEMRLQARLAYLTVEMLPE